jgi:hypothetical protein
VTGRNSALGSGYVAQARSEAVGDQGRGSGMQPGTAPKYAEGWFEASFPDVLEVLKANPGATWTLNEDTEEWVLDKLWWNGEMEDRIAQWHEPKEDWA